MSKIAHPLTVGTNVQYLSPRCPCSGKSFALVSGVVKKATKTSNGEYYYTIRGDRKNIPQAGIIKVLSLK